MRNVNSGSLGPALVSWNEILPPFPNTPVGTDSGRQPPAQSLGGLVILRVVMSTTQERRLLAGKPGRVNLDAMTME